MSEAFPDFAHQWIHTFTEEVIDLTRVFRTAEEHGLHTKAILVGVERAKPIAHAEVFILNLTSTFSANQIFQKFQTAILIERRAVQARCAEKDELRAARFILSNGSSGPHAK